MDLVGPEMVNVLRPTAGRLDPGWHRLPIRPHIVRIRGACDKNKRNCQCSNKHQCASLVVRLLTLVGRDSHRANPPLAKRLLTFCWLARPEYGRPAELLPECGRNRARLLIFCPAHRGRMKPRPKRLQEAQLRGVPVAFRPSTRIAFVTPVTRAVSRASRSAQAFE